MRQIDDSFDVFLSHASADKEWVRTLDDELNRLGVRGFLDEREIQPGQNFVLKLSDALAKARYLVLIHSKHSVDRPWVLQEWTGFMAEHGPQGRVIPVVIDSVQIPTILKPIHHIEGLDRDAARIAREIFKVVGDPKTLASDDARRLYLGRDLIITLSRDGDQLSIVRPNGTRRETQLPWKVDNRFGIAHLGFTKLTQQPALAADRQELFTHARTLGEILFGLLFDTKEPVQALTELIGPDRPRPVITIRSDDDLLLSMPWELLHHNSGFLVRDGRVDLVRTTLDHVAGETFLRQPTEQFKLVVNVSAPADAHLRYEAESYRITLALADRCPMTSTELGTLEDLVETVDREKPTGIHISGHGQPGRLLFEDDEGRSDSIEIGRLVGRLREILPDDRRLPPLFYLASCHGNDPGAPSEDKTGSWSSASQLHRAGVTQVVGYFGPIVDELSTRAEEAFYDAIAGGRTTRDAIRQARLALAKPFHAPEAMHRPGLRSSDAAATQEAQAADVDTQPFAWSQLVLYHRGPEFPLSAIPGEPGARPLARVLRRTFEGLGNRRVLRTGFIGRRTELHRARRKIREGDRVFVFQGLGGLGKSTLTSRVLPMLAGNADQVCVLWCQEVEGETDLAEALVGQLLDFCRNRIGLEWEGVVQQVDRVPNPALRFLHYLSALAKNMPRLVLYLDNLESLLVGPRDTTQSDELGQWVSDELQALWEGAAQIARDGDRLFLVASVRYRNPSYANALIPVSTLPPDALFRLMEWFPGLQRLCAGNRARLVGRLEGHPRAVEYANDLIEAALRKRKETHGAWHVSPRPSEQEQDREWKIIVDPALPAVDDKLRDDLLLRTIWDQVLNDRTRRMLHRMTILRSPASWNVVLLLGEPDESEQVAAASAERLRDTSLLEQVRVAVPTGEGRFEEKTEYTLHPATVRFIEGVSGETGEILEAAHRRVGEYLESKAKDSPYIETDIEAGHHLLQGGEFDRAYGLLGSASVWLQEHGRVRGGLRVLEPFLSGGVREAMTPTLLGRVLGTVGSAYHRLGQVEKAIGYFEQGLVIDREIGDRQGEGAELGNLGVAYASLGQVEKAIGYFEQGLVIAREIGDRQGEGSALGNLGSAYDNLGQVEKAIGYYEQQLVIDREIGDRRGEGADLGDLGWAYASLGQVEKAIGYHEQHLVIAREIGDRQGEGAALGNLGLAYARLGQVEKAIGYYEQGLVIAREIGDRQGEGAALGNLGSAYASLGQVEKAIGYFEQGLVIAREIGDRRGEGADLGNLGLAYASLGQVEKAIASLEQSVWIGREIKDPRIVETCQAGLDRLRGRTSDDP